MADIDVLLPVAVLLARAASLACDMHVDPPTTVYTAAASRRRATAVTVVRDPYIVSPSLPHLLISSFSHLACPEADC